MANRNHIIVLDLESGGQLKRGGGELNCELVEPIQIAALAIDPRSLKPARHNATFSALMRPEGDFEARMDPKALKHNKKTTEEIRAAVPREVVWQSFHRWASSWNPTPSQIRTAPILAGKNVRYFDGPILNWMSKRYKTADKNGVNRLFHPRRVLDLDDYLFAWFEGNSELPDHYSFDVVRPYLGVSNDDYHDALADVRITAEILCRFLQLHRRLFPTVPFRGSLSKWTLPGSTPAASTTSSSGCSTSSTTPGPSDSPTPSGPAASGTGSAGSLGTAGAPPTPATSPRT